MLCFANRFALFLICLASLSSIAAADVFGLHTSSQLRKIASESDGLSEISMDALQDLKPLSRTESTPAAVIKTSEGNWTKARISWGFRKGADKPIPVLLIEEFVTYRDDKSDVTVASGKEVLLFAGFAYDLDIGQVVPADQGGDIMFSAEKVLRGLDETRIWGIDGNQLPQTADEKPAPADREGVLPSDFTGTWQVDTDGRWKGLLRLKSTNAGRITGTFTSDETKSTYEVSGRVASPTHHARLTIQLDNAQQNVDAWLWTKDKSILAGSSSLAGQTFGFYALRSDEK